MRLSFLLLVAAVALLSSGTVVSAMTNDEPISTPNQVLSSETEGRKLRMHNIASDDTEERGFNAQKFEQLMDDGTYRSKRFANWVTKRYTDTDIYNKLQISSNPKYKRILNKYQTYIEHFAPGLISP
ncbi:hypothetical protein DVH05_005214 [Phytophthora capsici]|nr:hypothetical protein DVH05_012250 [Phytophthora capsici]KAG1687341.1 hypothetical protein DVH05_005214 [Phytophthora capsici]|eukprot:jgi/Phyca11/534478/estExt2_fgenesh1_pg.C_PHYCAscaffold_240034